MLARYEPARALYCALVSGTTESLPWRTSGESAKSGLDLIWASDAGFGRALPALIFTCGLLGFAASTETTVAVPTAVLWSPDCMPRRFRSATGLETPSQIVAPSFCRSAKEYSDGSVFRR